MTIENGNAVAPPTVSVGLPVYNGEAYLDAALESLTAQDFQDFEIVVCDNASTDGTAAIVQRWAERDPRIRYFRNDVNIGADRNFNRTFQLARGKYFRWAAGDDLVAPDHLRRCLMSLEATPDAVLCQSYVRIIDSEGRELGLYDGGLRGAESPDVPDRFAALVLSRHLCTHVFGVVRADALRATGLLGDYYGSDRVTLAALALMGRFIHVPEPLFMNREHPERGSRAMRSKFGAGGPLIWMVYRDYWRAVAKFVRDADDRRRSRRHLLRWWFADWNLARLVVEIVGWMYAPVHDWVHRMKVRFYGPLPQLNPRRTHSRHRPRGQDADPAWERRSDERHKEI